MKLTFKKKPNLRLMSIVPISVVGRYELSLEWKSYIRNMMRKKLVTVTFEWED